jgi:hypothetical protein
LKERHSSVVLAVTAVGCASATKGITYNSGGLVE